VDDLAEPEALEPAPAVGQDVLIRVVPMLIGRVATMVAQFVSLALIGRVLGPTEFGALQLAMVTFVFLTLLSDLGISVLGTRDNVRTRTSGWVGVYLGARLVLGVLVVGAVAVASVLLDLQPRDVLIVTILAVGLMASALSLRWLLQARERFAHIAAIDVAAAIAQLASAIALVVFDGGLIWAAATVALGPVVSAVLTFAAMRGSLERPRIGAATVSLVRMAAPAGIAVIATSIYFYVDTILLGILRSPTEVGYYGAAYRFVFAALALPAVANAVALPVLSRIVSGPREELRATLSSTATILLYIAVPLAAGTSIMAPRLVEWVFGPAYAPAAEPLAILIWTCVTVSANTAFAALMLARRDDRRYMLICLLGGVINILLNLVAIPAFGVVGAAATAIVTEVVVLVLIVVSTADVAPRILARAVGSSIMPTVIMALAMWPLRDGAAAIVVGITVWSATGLLIGTIRPSRLRSFVDAIRARQNATIGR
jgi:O-antigen/teichoic acid export membrane protein